MQDSVIRFGLQFGLMDIGEDRPVVNPGAVIETLKLIEEHPSNLPREEIEGACQKIIRYLGDRRFYRSALDARDLLLNSYQTS